MDGIVPGRDHPLTRYRPDIVRYWLESVVRLRRELIAGTLTSPDRRSAYGRDFAEEAIDNGRSCDLARERALVPDHDSYPASDCDFSTR
jgi:hypothetical protein